MTNIQQGYEHDGLGGGGLLSLYLFLLVKKSDYLMYSAIMLLLQRAYETWKS